MAVTMMCEPGTPGAVRSDYWSKEGRDIWMVTTHKGLVVGLREMNGYDDSDFYATVWNEEKGAPEEIMYASTRGWTYPNGAAVDATDEVKAKYAAYTAKLAAAARAAAGGRRPPSPGQGQEGPDDPERQGQERHRGRGDRHDLLGRRRQVRPELLRRAPKLRVGFDADDGRKVFIAGDAVEVVAA